MVHAPTVLVSHILYGGMLYYIMVLYTGVLY